MAEGTINFTLYQGLRKAVAILTPSQRKKGVLQVLLVILSGALEVVGLAAILPVIMVLQKPEIIQESETLQQINNTFGFTESDEFIIFMLISLFGLFIFKNGVIILINVLQSNFAFDVAKDLTKRQFYRAMNLKYLDFREDHSGKWIRDILSMPHFFATGVILPSITLASEFMVLAFIIAGMAIYDFKLFAGIVLLMGPAFWLLYWAVRKKVTKLGERKFALEPEVFTNLQESIVGIMDVKMTGRVDFFFQRFFRPKNFLFNATRSLHVYTAMPLRIFETFAVLGIVFIALYAVIIMKSSSTMVQYVSLFAIAAYRVLPSLNRMLTSIMSIKNNYHTLPVLETMKKDDVEIPDAPTVTQPIPFKNSIKFNDVSFRYSDKEKHALNGISFEVKKGQKVGFIGQSGSGKSTLMNILLRFIKESNGSIEVDGRKLEEGDTESWWQQVGYVKQDVFIMRATLKENIALAQSKDEINDAKVKEVVRQAGLEEFVDGLAKGIDTKIDEKGSNLSGGQRQRIGIARALYKDAEIVVFDEATSNLDRRTEEVVTESIDKLSEQGKTIFIIAHRHSTLRGCDRIFELLEGRIVREGSFAEITS